MYMIMCLMQARLLTEAFRAQDEEHREHAPRHVVHPSHATDHVTAEALWHGVVRLDIHLRAGVELLSCINQPWTCAVNQTIVHSSQPSAVEKYKHKPSTKYDGCNPT